MVLYQVATTLGYLVSQFESAVIRKGRIVFIGTVHRDCKPIIFSLLEFLNKEL